VAMTPYQKIMYRYGQQAPFTYPSYSNQVTGGYDPSLYSRFGLLNPSSNYQYGDGLYGGGGDSGGGSGISSSGSPTGSALGDLGYAISNQSISPIAAAIASGLMDALSSTSVNSVNAISGLDAQSDAATAAGASTAAGVDGVAGAGSTGMGGGIGGESGDASAAVGGDSGAAGGGGGGAVGDSGSVGDSGAAGGGGGGAVGSDGSGVGDGEYMGGFIGMPKYIQGMVTRQNTFGGNPAGPDDSYRKTQLGEYVIKKSAVQKYGRGLLDMINSESIPKTKLRGLL